TPTRTPFPTRRSSDLKVAEGHRLIPEQEPAYLCGVVRTARGDTKITLGLTSAGPPCDQNPQIVPNGSVLEAAGNTIIRADGFARSEEHTSELQSPDHL